VTTSLTIIEQELGYFALAIVQAGAYIFKSECGLGRYLEMYQERRGTLLEEYRMQVQKIDDYERTVYTTWFMSFEQLSPHAATFFKICAFFKICVFLHHDGISEAIFQNAARNLENYAPHLPATNEELDSLSVAKDFMNWFQPTEGLWQQSDTVIVTTTSTTTSGSGRVGPGSTHSPNLHTFNLADRLWPQKSHEQHPLLPPPSITTLNDGEADVANREDPVRPNGPGSRMDGRLSSMDDRRVAGAAPRPGTAPPVQRRGERYDWLTPDDRSIQVLPSKLRTTSIDWEQK